MRILLVEDDPDVLESTARLVQAFGYEVVTCAQASQLLKTVRNERPQLVLLDALMPGLDLRTKLRELRSNDRINNIRIVLFTASFGARELAQEVGADDVIEKPFDPEALRSLLRHWEARMHESPAR